MASIMSDYGQNYSMRPQLMSNIKDELERMLGKKIIFNSELSYGVIKKVDIPSDIQSNKMYQFVALGGTP